MARFGSPVFLLGSQPLLRKLHGTQLTCVPVPSLCPSARTPTRPRITGELLQQRASVASNVRRLVAGFREAEAAEKAAAAMPSYGSTVTVMSESQVCGSVGGCVLDGWGQLIRPGL